MIRVVFDTKIAVSALFWGGAPRVALSAARDRRFQLISSEPLLAELRDVLGRTKFSWRLAFIGTTVNALLDDYRSLVEVVEPAEIGSVIEDDPDDDRVLACAVGGGAHLIVSGDAHLLALQRYSDIEICPVGRFLTEGLERDR